MRTKKISRGAAMLLAAAVSAGPMLAQSEADKHVVSLGELSKDAASPGDARRANEAEIRHLFATIDGQKALKSADVEYAKIDRAVSSMSDEETKATTYFHRAKAAELKASTDFDTMYGTVPTRVMRVDTISFGGATLHTPIVYSQDFHTSVLGTYRGLDAEGLDGLIGYDLLAGTIVKLDVYGSKMSVLDPSTLTKTVLDLKSIMLYPIPADLITDPSFATGWNTSLSPIDIEFIGQLYPW